MKRLLGVLFLILFSLTTSGMQQKVRELTPEEYTALAYPISGKRKKILEEAQAQFSQSPECSDSKKKLIDLALDIDNPCVSALQSLASNALCLKKFDEAFYWLSIAVGHGDPQSAFSQATLLSVIGEIPELQHLDSPHLPAHIQDLLSYAAKKHPILTGPQKKELATFCVPYAKEELFSVLADRHMQAQEQYNKKTSQELKELCQQGMIDCSLATFFVNKHVMGDDAKEIPKDYSTALEWAEALVGENPYFDYGYFRASGAHIALTQIYNASQNETEKKRAGFLLGYLGYREHLDFEFQNAKSTRKYLEEVSEQEPRALLMLAHVSEDEQALKVCGKIIDSIKTFAPEEKKNAVQCVTDTCKRLAPNNPVEVTELALKLSQKIKKLNSADCLYEVAAGLDFLTTRQDTKQSKHKISKCVNELFTHAYALGDLRAGWNLLSETPDEKTLALLTELVAKTRQTSADGFTQLELSNAIKLALTHLEVHSKADGKLRATLVTIHLEGLGTAVVRDEAKAFELIAKTQNGRNKLLVEFSSQFTNPAICLKAGQELLQGSQEKLDKKNKEAACAYLGNAFTNGDLKIKKSVISEYLRNNQHAPALNTIKKYCQELSSLDEIQDADRDFLSEKLSECMHQADSGNLVMTRGIYEILVGYPNLISSEQCGDVNKIADYYLHQLAEADDFDALWKLRKNFQKIPPQAYRNAAHYWYLLWHACGDIADRKEKKDVAKRANLQLYVQTLKAMEDQDRAALGPDFFYYNAMCLSDDPEYALQSLGTAEKYCVDVPEKHDLWLTLGVEKHLKALAEQGEGWAFVGIAGIVFGRYLHSKMKDTMEFNKLCIIENVDELLSVAQKAKKPFTDCKFAVSGDLEFFLANEYLELSKKYKDRAQEFSDRAIEYLESSCQKNYKESLFKWADLYLTGNIPISLQNQSAFEKAIIRLIKANALGVDNAATELATIYKQGLEYGGPCKGVMTTALRDAIDNSLRSSSAQLVSTVTDIGPTQPPLEVAPPYVFSSPIAHARSCLERRDYAKAYELFEKEANQGPGKPANAAALAGLGIMHRDNLLQKIEPKIISSPEIAREYLTAALLDWDPKDVQGMFLVHTAYKTLKEWPHPTVELKVALAKHTAEVCLQAAHSNKLAQKEGHILMQYPIDRFYEELGQAEKLAFKSTNQPTDLNVLFTRGLAQTIKTLLENEDPNETMKIASIYLDRLSSFNKGETDSQEEKLVRKPFEDITDVLYKQLMLVSTERLRKKVLSRFDVKTLEEFKKKLTIHASRKSSYQNEINLLLGLLHISGLPDVTATWANAYDGLAHIKKAYELGMDQAGLALAHIYLWAPKISPKLTVSKPQACSIFEALIKKGKPQTLLDLTSWYSLHDNFAQAAACLKRVLDAKVSEQDEVAQRLRRQACTWLGKIYCIEPKLNDRNYSETFSLFKETKGSPAYDEVTQFFEVYSALAHSMAPTFKEVKTSKRSLIPQKAQEPLMHHEEILKQLEKSLLAMRTHEILVADFISLSEKHKFYATFEDWCQKLEKVDPKLAAQAYSLCGWIYYMHAKYKQTRKVPFDTEVTKSLEYLDKALSLPEKPLLAVCLNHQVQLFNGGDFVQIKKGFMEISRSMAQKKLTLKDAPLVSQIIDDAQSMFDLPAHMQKPRENDLQFIKAMIERIQKL